MSTSEGLPKSSSVIVLGSLTSAPISEALRNLLLSEMTRRGSVIAGTLTAYDPAQCIRPTEPAVLSYAVNIRRGRKATAYRETAATRGHRRHWLRRTDSLPRTTRPSQIQKVLRIWQYQLGGKVRFRLRFLHREIRCCSWP